MYILGLNIGHNSTACLQKNNKIVGCVSEERFSRIKNHSGMPFRSIQYLLKNEGITINSLDLVVLDAHYPIIKDPDFGRQFLEAYTKKSMLKRMFSGMGYYYPEFFERYSELKRRVQSSDYSSLKQAISNKLHVPEKKIRIIDHHLAHALSTCFNIKRGEKTLIFTLDGEGSGICASVNIWDGENLSVISRSKKSASLGYLYAITTIQLGMKPLQHEFKVMGLAPYAKEHNVTGVYSKLKNLIWINGSLEFKSKFSMPFADYFFNKEMRFTRFDNMSAAVQKLVEELGSEWVRRAIKKTGIQNIALAGGVFMNVKANQKIAELPEVKTIFVMPSCGDESNAIGACFFGYKELCNKRGIKLEPFPIGNLYLGPEYDDEYLKNLFKVKNLNAKFKIKKSKNISKDIARILARGGIVGRCTGRSEWGARALGNRSILANPKHKDTIMILNELIKDRDFWMPFTPTILDKFEKRYIKNPKKIPAPYMVITFDSTILAKDDLTAAMHPYDLTIRPQILTKGDNKEYYDLIKEFERLTGIGGVLNTSFNLHGEPNVLTPEDAIHTVENSGLKYLALNNHLLEKR